jgi:hypothetical protein
MGKFKKKTVTVCGISDNSPMLNIRLGAGAVGFFF